MSINLDTNQIANGTISNVLAGIVLAILALAVLDEKKVLRPWIYRMLNPFAARVVEFLIKLLEFLVNPWLRIVLIVYLLYVVNSQAPNLIVSFLITVSAISLFLWKPKSKSSYNPAPEIADGFEKLDKKIWSIKTGQPVIENDFGKPAPGLGMPMATPAQATNSFLTLAGTSFERGVVECDFYLEYGAVFNISIFCNIKEDNWYMARYDSRGSGSSDGILIKSDGPGVNWKFHKMSGTQTKERVWHRARVEFSSEKISMYKDGELVSTIDNPQIFGKDIGFFNECEYVHVDNFYISRT